MRALIKKFDKQSTEELNALVKGGKLKVTETAAVSTILNQRSTETPVIKMTPKKEPVKKTPPKKPGVIQTIFNLIDEKLHITNTEIFYQLEKTFSLKKK
jgi:hypothetical protein